MYSFTERESKKKLSFLPMLRDAIRLSFSWKRAGVAPVPVGGFVPVEVPFGGRIKVNSCIVHR